MKAETGAPVADYSVPLFWKRRSAIADDQRFKCEAERLGAKCAILKYGDALTVWLRGGA